MHFRMTGVAVAAVGAGALLPTGAAAQTLDLQVQIPRLSVAEYHNPYVAIWLQKEGAPARTLGVWYDLDNREGGAKWLNEVRQWWRASGRTMKFPANGITGATRAPGTHRVSFTAGRGALPALTPGEYTLVIEAAREVGGRELLRLPFNWNGSTAVTARAQGKSELGLVTLSVKR